MEEVECKDRVIQEIGAKLKQKDIDTHQQKLMVNTKSIELGRKLVRITLIHSGITEHL